MGAATETVRNSKTASSNVLLKTLDGKVADVLNEILDLNQPMVSEFDRISRAVGKEGKISQRASLGSVSGAWSECVESVNSLIGDLVQPSTEVARVIGAVAKGDLSAYCGKLRWEDLGGVDAGPGFKVLLYTSARKP